MKISDELKAAKALIEKGWIQGHYSDGAVHSWDDDDATCFCSAGAISRAAGLPAMYTASFEVFCEALGKNPSEPLTEAHFEKVVSWNDKPERTKADVLRAFDRAIELAERG